MLPRNTTRSAVNNSRLRIRARVGLTAPTEKESAGATTIGVIAWVGSIAGTGIGAYHGYGRNGGSVGWAIGWGILGSIFWPIVIPLALAQGLGKRAR